MKFEKFLKSVGTHGEVINRNESEKWLLCGGVGMVIPRGVTNLLGGSRSSEYASIVDVISNVSCDDALARLALKRAVLFEADGKAGDIYRVFANDLDEEIGIMNADYGLIERRDVLSYLEIEVDTDENGNPLPPEDCKTVKYMLVFNAKGDIQGFITGSARF